MASSSPASKAEANIARTEGRGIREAVHIQRTDSISGMCVINSSSKGVGSAIQIVGAAPRTCNANDELAFAGYRAVHGEAIVVDLEGERARGVERDSTVRGSGTGKGEVCGSIDCDEVAVQPCGRSAQGAAIEDDATGVGIIATS